MFEVLNDIENDDRVTGVETGNGKIDTVDDGS